MNEQPIYTQYLTIKTQYPRHLVLFRVGDFLEAFALDALEVARLLNITVVKVKGHDMAGFPFAMAEESIGKLIAAGWHVALAEPVKQTPPGEPVKRLMTQGTLFAEANA